MANKNLKVVALRLYDKFVQLERIRNGEKGSPGVHVVIPTPISPITTLTSGEPSKPKTKGGD